MNDKERALKDMQESMEFQVRRKQQIHEAVPIVNGGASTEESGPTIESALRELLRLYDWRNELGAIERDFNHDQKQMRRVAQPIWQREKGSVGNRPQGAGVTLRKRILELVERHGSLRAVGRVTQIDAAYLSRLTCGEKTCPSKETLRRLGLRAVITYERVDRTARETSTVAQDK